MPMGGPQRNKYMTLSLTSRHKAIHRGQSSGIAIQTSPSSYKGLNTTLCRNSQKILMNTLYLPPKNGEIQQNSTVE